MATPSKFAVMPAPLSDTHRLVRERYFPSAHNLTGIINLLRDSGATGVLTIDMINGGMGSIHFREEQKVEFDK